MCLSVAILRATKRGNNIVIFVKILLNRISKSCPDILIANVVGKQMFKYYSGRILQFILPFSHKYVLIRPTQNPKMVVLTGHVLEILTNLVFGFGF